MDVNDYSLNVFINCPFDIEYIHLRNALIFTILDCGFVPRCALEEDDSGNVRFEKIKKLIRESKLGVHDISRTEMTEIDETQKLPRFNMPFELGVFIGAKYFGDKDQKIKKCIIFDTEKYRYQAFISDIAGHDISAHNNEVRKLIVHMRNWLNTACKNETILPGGNEIIRKFRLFEKELPDMCKTVPVGIEELTYNDYTWFVSKWLDTYLKKQVEQNEESLISELG